MSFDVHEPATKPATVLKRRRRILMGSVLALALGGLVAGETLVGPTLPAFAQDAPTATVNQPVSFADVVDKVKPAVISVRVKTLSPQTSSLDDDSNSPFFRDLPQGHPLERFFREFRDFDNRQGRNRPQPRREFSMAQGSGFFISADGYAVTNNHVVENATEVDVTTEDGKTYTAKVVGTDPRTDLALLKVDEKGEFAHVNFAQAAPRVGDWVVAIGNPFGLGGTVTAGIVSARGRDIGAGQYDDFLQIDAAVNRGNSGGPTFNLNGEVVGVNTAIFSPSGGNVGIAFAVPSELATRVIAELKETGSVTRGWLGIQIQPVTPEIAEGLNLSDARGAIVIEPQRGSPAEKAGIRSQDVIVSVNGSPVADAKDLSRKIANFKPGTSVDLKVVRDGRERDVKVDLGTMPDNRSASVDTNEDDNAGKEAAPAQPSEMANLGLSLESASGVAGAGQDGVVVTDVDPNGKVADRLRSGDVILEVAGKAVKTPAEVAAGISDAAKEGRKSVLLRVKNGEAVRFVAIPVAQG